MGLILRVRKWVTYWVRQCLAPVCAAALAVGVAQTVHAQVVTDWGAIATPLDNDVTFSFAQYDISANFTDRYLFSLDGSGDAAYSLTFNFNNCERGCGSPELSYGLYNENGNLIDGIAGNTLTLSAGSYAFEVKGTGFGAGNSVDYFGSVTIKALTMISPTPEPSTWALIVMGLLGFAWHAKKRQNQSSRPPLGVVCA